MKKGTKEMKTKKKPEEKKKDIAEHIQKMVFRTNIIPIIVVLFFVNIIIIGFYLSNSIYRAKEQIEMNASQESACFENDIKIAVNIAKLSAAYVEEHIQNQEKTKKEETNKKIDKEINKKTDEEMLRFFFKNIIKTQPMLKDISYTPIGGTTISASLDKEESFYYSLEESIHFKMAVAQNNIIFKYGKGEFVFPDVLYAVGIPVHKDGEIVGVITELIKEYPMSMPYIKNEKFMKLIKDYQIVCLFNEKTGEILNSNRSNLRGTQISNFKLERGLLEVSKKDKIQTTGNKWNNQYFIYYNDLSQIDLSILYFWPANKIYLYALKDNFWTYTVIILGIWMLLVISIIMQKLTFGKFIYDKIKQNIVANSFWNTILNSDNIAMIYLSNDFYIQDATPSIIEELCGIKLEDAKEKNLLTLIKAEELERFLLQYEKGTSFLDSLTFSCYNFVQCNKSWMYAEVKTIYNAEEKPFYLILLLRSTERIMAAKTLDSIMEVSRNSVLVINEAKEITYISKKFAQQLGFVYRNQIKKYPISEMKNITLNGKTFLQLFEFVEQHGDLEESMYIECLGTQIHPWWAQVNISIFYIMDEIAGMLCVMTNITEYLTKEAEAYKAVRLKEDLLRTLSHGIRTPLNVIVGTSDLMTLSADLNMEQKKQIETIREASGSLIEIMDEIVDYAGIDKAKENFQKEYFLKALIIEIMNSINIIAVIKQIDIYLDIDPEISNRQFGDEGNLKKAMYYLLYYCIDIVEQGFIKIKIRSRPKDEFVLLQFTIDLFDSALNLAASFDSAVNSNVFSNSDVNSVISNSVIPKENGIHNKVQDEFKFTVAKELIYLMNGSIEKRVTKDQQIQLFFELPVQYLDEMPLAKVENAERKQILMISERAEFIKVFQNAAKKLKIRCYMKEDHIDFADINIIFLDYKSKDREKWLKQKLPVSCQLIFMAYSRDIPGTKIESGYKTLYQPICCFKIADCLNQKIETKSLEQNLFHTKGVNILVVDDNEVNLMVIQNMLKFYKIEVDLVDNAMKALEMIKEKTYDIVFMDHLMSNMDGVEATKRIRKLPFPKNKTIVIALSANLVSESIALFEAAQVSDIMAKPVELPVLCHCLKKWIPKEKIITESFIQPQQDIEQQKSIKQQNIEQKQNIGQQQDIQQQQNMGQQQNTKKQNDTEQILLTNKSSARELLKKIKELDFDLGLKYAMGNEEQYMRIAKASCITIKTSIEKGTFFLNESSWEEKEYEEMKLIFHSLKGIFLNLGIHTYPETAKQLQLAANEKDRSQLLNQLPAFIKDCKEILMELERAVEAYNIAEEFSITDNEILDEAVEKNFTEDEIKNLIREILCYIERFEIDFILKGLEELMRYIKKEQKKQVEQAIHAANEFDYETVRIIVEQLKEII